MCKSFRENFRKTMCRTVTERSPSVAKKSQSDEKVQLCCKHKQENPHGLRINRSTRRRPVLIKRYVTMYIE